MRKAILSTILPFLLIALPASDAAEISPDRIRAAVAHLASDPLEGRAPGTNGEVLATEFIADEFEKQG